MLISRGICLIERDKYDALTYLGQVCPLVSEIFILKMYQLVSPGILEKCLPI